MSGIMKPSDFPKGVVIETRDDTWEKSEGGVWFDANPHCADCDRIVFDGGPTEDQQKVFRHVWELIVTPSDEYFDDFRIVSVPMLVVEYMVEEFAKMTGSGLLLKEVLENVKKYEDI